MLLLRTYFIAFFRTHLVQYAECEWLSKSCLVAMAVIVDGWCVRCGAWIEAAETAEHWVRSTKWHNQMAAGRRVKLTFRLV